MPPPLDPLLLTPRESFYLCCAHSEQLYFWPRPEAERFALFSYRYIRRRVKGLICPGCPGEKRKYARSGRKHVWMDNLLLCPKSIRLIERSQHELGVVPPDVDLVDGDRLRVRELGLLAQQEREDVAQGSVEDAASVDGLDVKKSGN